MNESRRVIIIGTGPTGAMAALQLSRRGIPITILESGTAFSKGFLLRAMGKTVLRCKPPLESRERHVSSGDPQSEWHHSLAPGGLSNHWTGAVPRFAPEDFHEGARLHEMYRWPITYEDIAPYYPDVERLLQITADPRAVSNLPASLSTHRCSLPKDWQVVSAKMGSQGQGLTVMPIADGGPWMAAHQGTGFNSFSDIIAKLPNGDDVRVITGAHVLQLVWSGNQRNVTDVVYYDHTTEKQKRLKAAAVVLAAGPLASTKILFHSACPDFPQGLGNSHGILGRYLHDHLHDWWLVDFERPLSRLRNTAYLTRAPYAESPPLMAAQYTISHPFVSDKMLSALPSRTRTFGVNVFGTMRPTELNYVALHNDAKDRYDRPLLDICIQYDVDSLCNLNTARKRFLSLFEQAGFRGKISTAISQPVPGRSVHYGGTVRMHESPEYGMLNAWNRLHEVRNVVVADASCFTTGVEKNPTLTAMAIAARAADRLADDLKKD